MPIDHAETRWGNFLRTVKAATGQNVQVVGQFLEDNLRATVQAADLTHLSSPTRWTAWGFEEVIALQAGEFAKLEIRAVVPFYLEWLSLLQDANVEILEAHTLATADLAPAVQFGDAPAVRYRIGTDVGAPAANVLRFEGGTTTRNVIPIPSRQWFCPQGKVMSISHVSAGLGLTVGVSGYEIPNPATAP